MAQVAANGIQIEYETFGDPDSPPLLLIIGLSLQLIDWDEELCRQLAQRGHYVIRFDNRDTGLSSKLEDAGVPDIPGVIEGLMRGEPVDLPYTIEDMAADAVALLDALGIEKAHICGMSMGGMIAQTIALEYPERVLSLISIYSGTGDPKEPRGGPEMMEFLATPPPEDREAYIEHALRGNDLMSGPGFPCDPEQVRGRAAWAYDRCYYPEGAARQLAAIIGQRNRRPVLASLRVPTLVIHGSDDPVVPVGCGRLTASAIPGAKLMIIEGMGHDIPYGGAWPQIVDAIVEHTHQVEA